MKKKYETFIDLLDIPSGSLLGLYTLIMIGMSVSCFFKHSEIPTSVITVYEFVVASFAGSKAVKTIWGKAIPEAPEVPKA